MQKSAIAVVIAIFLLLAGLYNIGAGLAHFGKAAAVSSATSGLASLGDSVANLNKNNPYMQDSKQALQDSSSTFRNQGAMQSALMYLVAIGIVLAAVVQVVGGIGVFSSAIWAPKVLLIAGVGGILVELQDVMEDGIGAGQLVFLAICAAAIWLSLRLKATPTPAAAKL